MLYLKTVNSIALVRKINRVWKFENMEADFRQNFLKLEWPVSGYNLETSKKIVYISLDIFICNWQS
jgi:hypothetical protein